MSSSACYCPYGSTDDRCCLNRYPYVTINNEPIPQRGWICPKCNTANAPWAPVCMSCPLGSSEEER